MNTKLTNKQKIFCKEYLVDLNATQAAIRAGYSEKTATAIACENLTKPNIAAEIQKLFNERAEKARVNADYVLNNIIEIGERCMQRVPVTYYDKVDKEYKQKTEMDDNGNEVGVWEFKEAGALRAQELLGKHIKLFGADGSRDNPFHVVMPTIKVDGKAKEYNIGDGDPETS